MSGAYRKKCGEYTNRRVAARVVSEGDTEEQISDEMLGEDVVAVSVGNSRPRTICVSFFFFSVSVSGCSTLGERFVVFHSPGRCFQYAP